MHVTSLTIVAMVRQWVKLWDPLLHKYGFNCRTLIDWLPLLPNVTLGSSRLTGAGFAPTSEVRTSAILKWSKLWDQNL
jgi:hypothetical protein